METPITEKFMRIALALIFLHKDYCSGVLKMGYARENLDLFEQVCRTDMLKILENSLCRIHWFCPFSTLELFFWKSALQSSFLPILSYKSCIL